MKCQNVTKTWENMRFRMKNIFPKFGLDIPNRKKVMSLAIQNKIGPKWAVWAIRGVCP